MSQAARPVRSISNPRLLAAIAAWASLATWFAFHRGLYDDEWFSLVVSRDLTDKQAIAVLSRDIHPPWVALFDRLLAHLANNPHVYRLFRLAASATAVYFLSRIAARRFRLRIPALAAFHPIIVMYAVCLRWYPYLFLAQALRAWALWGTRNRKKGYTAFLIGGILGPVTSYADFAFLIHDSVWLVVRAKEGRKRLESLSLVLGIAAANLLFLWLSPLSTDHRSLLAHRAGPGLLLRGAVEWLGTGLIGQALLPGKWALLALLPIPAFLWAAIRVIREPRTRRLGLWLVAIILGWCLVMAMGPASQPSQPRYSLMVWFFASASLLALARQKGAARAAAVVAIAYLAIALGLTVSQRYFLKGDLNKLPASACAPLLNPGAYDLIVAPYVKTAWELSTLCAPHAPIASASWSDHVWNREDELTDIESRLSNSRRLLLVTVPARESSLGDTNANVRRLIEARCSRIAEVEAVEDPHFALKSAFLAGVTEWRYRAELWECGAKP